jgi:hypothetical protein
MRRSTKSATRIVLAGAFAALGSFQWQRPAKACSPAPPPCVELPPQGTTFPANAVAFRLIDGRPPLSNWPPVPPCMGDPPLCPVVPPRPTFEESFGLRTEEGDMAVTASVKALATGERVFSPDEPLEPNRRYVLRYDNGFCYYGAKPEDFSFLTTESAFFARENK